MENKIDMDALLQECAKHAGEDRARMVAMAGQLGALKNQISALEAKIEQLMGVQAK